MTMEVLSKMGVLALAMMVGIGMGAANIVQPSTDSGDQPHVLGVDDSLPVEAEFDLSQYDIEEVDDVEVLIEDAQNENYTVEFSTGSDSLWDELQDSTSEFSGFVVSLTEDDEVETVEVEGDVDRDELEENEINLEDGEVTVTVTLDGTFETEEDGETVEKSTTVEELVTVDTDVPAVEVTSPEADAEVKLDDEEMAEVEAVFDSVATDFSAVYAVNDGDETKVVDMTEVSDGSNVFEAVGLGDVEEEDNVTVTVTGHEVEDQITEISSEQGFYVEDTDEEIFSTETTTHDLKGDLLFTADSASETVDFTVKSGEEENDYELKSGDEESLDLANFADDEDVTITASTQETNATFDYTVEDSFETVEDTGSDEVTFSVVESDSMLDSIIGDIDESSLGLVGVGLLAVLAVGGVVAYRQFM